MQVHVAAILTFYFFFPANFLVVLLGTSGTAAVLRAGRSAAHAACVAFFTVVQCVPPLLHLDGAHRLLQHEVLPNGQA